MCILVNKTLCSYTIFICMFHLYEKITIIGLQNRIKGKLKQLVQMSFFFFFFSNQINIDFIAAMLPYFLLYSEFTTGMGVPTNPLSHNTISVKHYLEWCIALKKNAGNCYLIK